MRSLDKIFKEWLVLVGRFRFGSIYIGEPRAAFGARVFLHPLTNEIVAYVDDDGLLKNAAGVAYGVSSGSNLAAVLAAGNDANALRITNLGTPTNGSDAATKSYVDENAGGGGGIGNGLVTVADDAARLALAPTIAGQWLYQLDTRQSWIADTDLTPGDWSQTLDLGHEDAVLCGQVRCGGGVNERKGILILLSGEESEVEAGAYITSDATIEVEIRMPNHDGTLATLAGIEALTNKTVNGLTISTTTGTLTVANGKTATFNSSLIFSGTDGTTMALPSTSASIARTDAPQTFTGTQTFASATSILLGTTGSAVGSVGFRNATSGTATLAPPTGALGTYSVTLPNAASVLPVFGQQITFAGPTAARTVTLPDAAFTVARTDAAQTFTGTQTFGAVVGTTWNGNTWAAGTGTLSIGAGKTFTASNTLTLAGTDGTTMTMPPVSASLGYLNIPQGSKTANYTAVLADAGGHILHAASDDNPRTFTIPANSSVAYPIGTTLTFVNLINTVTIAITTDTLTWAGEATTGSRTLAAAGIATAIKVSSTQWLITGVGLE